MKGGSAVKFKCEKCDYCARDHCNLIRHIETMHTDIEIKFLVCENVFTDKFAFIEHKTDCFLICTFIKCAKIFKTRSRLEAHKRMHIMKLRRN